MSKNVTHEHRQDGAEVKGESRENLVMVQLAEPETELEKRLLTGEAIGRGGTAVIKSAFDANLLRYVAKKELLPENASYKERRSKLIEEAQITSQLSHPNIVPVYEMSTDADENLFFTMKLVQGRTFASILDENSVEQRTTKELFSNLQILLKVCDAVAFAHSRGVIHRDLKPDNIMVGAFGEVYLMDWGLAKLQKGPRPSKLDTYMPPAPAASCEGRVVHTAEDEDGVLRGTLAYMTPEQARGDLDAMNERTDIFLLGGILYKILTHTAPYDERDTNNIYHLIYRAQQADIPPPEMRTSGDLPAALCQISMKALQKKPEDRHASVTEFKNEIETFMQSGWQFERRRFKAGTAIVTEGETGDTAYIITKGRCQVFRTVSGARKNLAEIGPGEVFGEVAVFTREARSASVVAIDDVTAMEIDRSFFEEDLGMSHWLGLLTEALAERYREKEQRVKELEREIGGKR
jgi:serine/threonine-protein kinase